MRTRKGEANWIEARQRWQISVQRDGVRRCFTDSTPGRSGKHLCEAKADKWLERFTTDQRLGAAFDMFMEDKEREVTRSVADMYRMRTRKILEIIPESKRLSAITLYDWQKVINALVDDGMAESTIRSYITTITAFSTYCRRRRWECEEVHGGDLEVRNAAKSKAKKALSRESFERLMALDETDNIYAYFYQLLALTGLRKGEGLGLRWSDVDISNKVLHVQRNLTRDGEYHSGKTDNAVRNVPLIDRAIDVLDAQRQLNERLGADGDDVFPEFGGQIYSAVSQQWSYNIRRLIQTDCTIHELRHTFISVTKGDLPLPLLKQVVGHSAAMDTIGTYGHETESDNRRSREAIQSAFNGVIDVSTNMST